MKVKKVRIKIKPTSDIFEEDIYTGIGSKYGDYKSEHTGWDEGDYGDYGGD